MTDLNQLVEAGARALYECEKHRSDYVDRLLSEAKGSPVRCGMEPWDECADSFRSDSRAAILAILPLLADDLAGVADSHSFGVDIDEWMRMTKKDISAHACKSVAEAIRTRISALIGESNGQS